MLPFIPDVNNFDFYLSCIYFSSYYYKILKMFEAAFFPILTLGITKKLLPLVQPGHIIAKIALKSCNLLIEFGLSFKNKEPK